MTEAQFAAYYAKYESAIRAVARKVGKTDDDLVDDLYQEGLMSLWKLDFSKVHTNEKAFVLQAARNRMMDYWRQQKRNAHESLDVKLAQGDQVVSKGGEKYLVEGPHGAKRDYDRDDEDGDYSTWASTARVKE